MPFNYDNLGEESTRLDSTEVISAGKLTRPALGGVVKLNNEVNKKLFVTQYLSMHIIFLW